MEQGVALKVFLEPWPDGDESELYCYQDGSIDQRCGEPDPESRRVAGVVRSRSCGGRSIIQR